MLKDWSFYKTGDAVEVFEPTARNWILNGIASEVVDKRSVPVEQAVADQQPERAESRPSRKKQ